DLTKLVLIDSVSGKTRDSLLSSEAVNDKFLIITGLEPNTKYIAKLFSDSLNQGRISFKTKGSESNLLKNILPLSNTIPGQAFPGALGFGRKATGGRGGKVAHVTNLNDKGSGSFREALKAYPNDPLTVVFDVSGVINLESPIEINRSNLTIAGQSAPGLGICLTGDNFKINGSPGSSHTTVNKGNIIVRYIRSRPIKEIYLGAYGFDMENAHDVIIDHCSFSWANEEDAAIYDTKYLTVQYCMLSEGLYNAGHHKGPRSYGGMWGGQYSSFHHNLWADN